MDFKKASNYIFLEFNKLLLGNLIFLIFFLIFDYLSLYFLPLQSSENNLPPSEALFQPKPYTMYGGAHEGPLMNAWKLNSLGYPGKVPEIKKSEDEYKIFIIGGSTVFTGNPSLSEIIEKKFVDAGNNKVHVYNFGVVSSVTRMDLSRLFFEVSDLQPDLVIFYGGGNSIIMPFQNDPRPGYPPNFPIYENNPLAHIEDSTGKYPFWPILLYKSRLLRYFAGNFLREKIMDKENLRLAFFQDEEEWSNKIASSYLQDIRKAKLLCNGLKIDFINFFQPLLYFKENLFGDELKWDFKEIHDHSILCKTKMLTGLNKLKEQDQLDSIDLSGIFSKSKEEIFIDGIHIKQSFFNIIAENIYENIILMQKRKIIGIKN